METYNKTIATNSQVELIHVSLDSNEDSAEEWAESAKFPWPTIMKDKSEKSGLMEFAGKGVPHYKLIDKEGNIKAEGKAQCLSKIKELTED